MLKLIRVTTVDLSLHELLEGQLGFLNKEFEVMGVAANTGLLKAVGEREGIRVIDVPMHRDIALWTSNASAGSLGYSGRRGLSSSIPTLRKGVSCP